MKLFFRLFAIWLLFGCAQVVRSQTAGLKIDRVDVKFAGPATVSEQFVRANIRVSAGDTYKSTSTQDDVHALYATGQFYNIRIALEQSTNDSGVVLTYIVQARPRLTEIKIVGNKKVSDSKIKKKITVKVGDPMDEQKLFTDVQDIKKLYEKYGYPDTKIQYVPTVDENAGRATVTFQIVESRKIKITEVDFTGAAAFTQKALRGVVKTKRHWMWSWLTGSGVFKQDEFDDDRDLLGDYYRNHGYLDFEIKNVRLDNPTTNTLVIKYFLYEGRLYKVGSIKLTGNKIFSDDQIRSGMEYNHSYQNLKGTLGAHGFAMDVGSIYTPDGLRQDIQALEDFYGSKGYIDVTQGPALRINRIPNVDTGTMDLEFQIDEGQKTYVEKINITGNVKTKDNVIRRELAISPGEVFDMVRVKISKQRLEGLNYFDKVDTDPEPTDPPISGHKNLDVAVTEKNTGNLTFGAGLSSDSGIVGFVEVSQGNFDLFHPPTFTGAGQKLRLRVAIGSLQRDYELSFVEPWFLNRKLALGVDLYRHQLDFESPNNIFNETQSGTRLSLTRALWSDFFIGSASYTFEQVGISLNSPYHGAYSTAPFTTVLGTPTGPGQIPEQFPAQPIPSNVPEAILAQLGPHDYSRFGVTLAYDTRNSTGLPNHGQRTEIDPELSVGDTDYYKVQLRTAWYFPGLMKGHVIEAVGRVAIADGLNGNVPFYDAYYLGGLYSLRGFKFRNVAPRDPAYFPGNPAGIPNEPIGGDSMWFGSVEYSIPIVEKDGGVGVRIATFLDAGSVGAGTTSFSGNFDDDVGLGLRINIPHMGPLRLDYGYPLTHDKYNGGTGQFQFGAGYTRQF